MNEIVGIMFRTITYTRPYSYISKHFQSFIKHLCCVANRLIYLCCVVYVLDPDKMHTRSKATYVISRSGSVCNVEATSKPIFKEIYCTTILYIRIQKDVEVEGCWYEIILLKTNLVFFHLWIVMERWWQSVQSGYFTYSNLNYGVKFKLTYLLTVVSDMKMNCFQTLQKGEQTRV
jgi:hypothetical protein